MHYEGRKQATELHIWCSTFCVKKASAINMYSNLLIFSEKKTLGRSHRWMGTTYILF